MPDSLQWANPMAAGNEDVDEVHFLSSNESVDIFKVQAKFVNLAKEELESSLRTLKFHNITVPISRFGTWVFEALAQEESGIKIAKNGGPIVAFVWALWRSYPEVSVWVEDTAECTFALEVEKGQKKYFLAEITSNKMKDKMQACFEESLDLDTKLKLIKIVTEKVVKSAPANQSDVPQGVLPPEKPHKVQSQAEKTNQDPSMENDWKYRKLRAEVGESQEPKEKLKKLIEFAICSCEMKKIDGDLWVFDAIRKLIPKFKASQKDVDAVLGNMRTFSQLLHSGGDSVKSIEVTLISAELLKAVRNQEKRVEQLNSDLGRTCKVLAKIYQVKEACIQVNVDAEDELGRGKPDRGSGTAYDQATRAQQRGKRAFKAFNFEEALRCYKGAIKFVPKEMLYHLDIGEVFLAQSKLQSCINECNEAIRLGGSEKNKARAHDLLGEAELRAYRPVEALKQFVDSLRIKEDVDVRLKFKVLDEALQRVFQDGANAHAQQALNAMLNPMFLRNPMFPFGLG